MTSEERLQASIKRSRTARKKWFDSELIQTLSNDPDEIEKIFEERAEGATYPALLQAFRTMSHSDERYKTGTVTAVHLSDWLSQAYPEQWLDAEKAWGFTMFEAAKAGALSKLHDREISETITNYDSEGEVVGVQVREKKVLADTKFIEKVLSVYDPDRWDKRSAIATKLDERKLEIQDAAMSQGSLSEDQAGEFKQIIEALTISAGTITPAQNKDIELNLKRSKAGKTRHSRIKNVDIIEGD